MPLYTPESLDRLRQRIDLVDVLSSHIDLKRAGATYKALCPFHDEKTPSFNLKPGDSHYHCFGCGAHGDAIQFLMNHLRMSFVEAVESLAERFNVVLDQMEGSQKKGPSKRLLREALSHAQQFFHFCLLHTADGHQALEYLYERGIDLDFIRRFRLGYAPRDGQLLRKYLHHKRVSDDVQREIGLLARESRRPFFTERIMFPIHSAQNAIIGFSARKFREQTFGGKYINTPETPLFKKSRVLFGLNYSRQRIAKERWAIVVEGQVDALRLIHLGLNCTVAGQGTAFGEGHAAELVQIGVERVFLALDADEAGREAACKIGNLFQKAGVAVRYVALPIGSDPDSLLLEEGPDVILQLLEDSVDYLKFLVEHRMHVIDSNSPAAKGQILKELVQQVRGWDNPVMVHESLRQLAQLTNVPETALGVGQEVVPNVLIRQQARVGSMSVNPDRILENDLLRWLVLCGEECPRYVRLVESNLSPEDLREEGCQELLKVYLQSYEAGRPCDPLSLLSQSDNAQLQDLIAELLTKKVNKERAEDQLIETVQRLLDRNWMIKRESVKAKIQSGNLSDDEVMALAAEFDRLRQQAPQVVVPEQGGE